MYSLLNENQIQSIHQDVGEDPIMTNLMDSLESNQASLSDWLLVVGNGEDVTRKAYKSLRHQRRDAETSSSGVTVWVLHPVLGLSTLPTTSELVSYRPQLRTLSS